MKRSLGTPDVLAKLGRPGFPKGMVVMLVGGSAQERLDIQAQMSNLGYQVTSCATCSQARQELTGKGAASFDIILAEATLVSKDSKDGQLLLEAAGNLPLVLISSPGTTTECVWRGLDVGAADVLERPLSLLKLQNIWQHVVRKVMETQDTSSTRGRQAGKEEETLTQAASPPSSRCTPSSSVSAVTVARFPDDKSGHDHEASYSGSQEGKETSQGASMSHTSPENSHTVDGPSVGSDYAQALEGKPAKKARKSKDSSANGPISSGTRPPLAIRPYPSQPIPQAAIGTPSTMGQPSWGQVGKGGVPPGCVWGTPMQPPPAWQGMYPTNSGPLLGSAAPTCPMARCHSAPVNKVDKLSNSVSNLDGLPDLDVALMGEFPDDLLLGDDFLDCGDNFLASFGAMEAPAAEPAALEKPPIGLRLRKSASLVDLINQHLQSNAAKGQLA